MTTTATHPEQFGDYRVLDRIGSGSVAEVFRARDTQKGRTVAIKVLRSDYADDPAARQALEEECLAAATLGHRHSAAVYGGGEQQGRVYLVYEFVQGQSLSALLSGRPLNPRRAIEFAVQMADALADAHAHGVAHRALRPDKVLVSLSGTAKIIDFGLGGFAIAAARRAATVGASASDMSYWAPEQRDGASGDARSDVYALGLILIEMLTGDRPTPSSLRSTSNDSVPGLANLLARMVALDPATRSEAATIAAELRAMETALLSQRPMVPQAVPAGRRRQTSRAWWWMVPAALLVVGLLWLWWR